MKSRYFSVLALFAVFTCNSLQAEDSLMADFEILRTEFLQTGGMDIDGNPGELSLSRLRSQLILSKPFELFGGISMIPNASYSFSQLDFDNTGLFPIHDEDLHSISLSSIFIKNFENSPWMGIGWTNAELATDFQGISSDDITFDVALGAAYQFSDELVLGFGVVLLNINNDEQLFPGINFVWSPNEQFRMSLFGPNFRTTYEMNDNWFLTLSGEPGGGVWNIKDDAGMSRSIDLDSYLIGINTQHRIYQNLWLIAGIGYTFGNEIEIRQNDGGAPNFSREMDGAPFARIGLSLANW
jgi:hypothetical protein